MPTPAAREPGRFRKMPNIETAHLEEVEQYIFAGGVYGGTQHLAAAQAGSGGRFRYVMNRAFPPLTSLKYGYPVLNEAPILLPLCWIHRLANAVIVGKMKQAKYELKKSRQEDARSRELTDLFSKLGI